MITCRGYYLLVMQESLLKKLDIMKTLSHLIGIIVMSCLMASCSDSGKEISAISPDGILSCIINTDSSAHLSYSISLDGENVILPSPLGVIVDGDDLGSDALLGKTRTKKVNEVYKICGVHSQAVNNYNEIIIPVTGGVSRSEWFLDMRIFSDAVAYRYRVPGEGKRKINGETSAWQVMNGTTMWYQTDRKKDYEMPYAKMMPDTVSTPVSLLTTSTFKLPRSLGYLMIGEANLIRYSDMALQTRGKGYFESLFHNSPEGWVNEGEIVSPWRVVVLTKSLDELVNTDAFHNLCPPPSLPLTEATWITPGKSTWAWMVTGKPMFKDQKKWVDWTSELGLDYYLIDDGWQKWSDGDKGQWEMMKEVVDYAKTKNVKIWAWVRTKEVETKEQRNKYISEAKAAGLVGLKIDFMGAANPEWVQWYDDILREMADAELMVNFHGANKPTGRERTWPHEMSREGIRGREMGKQSALHDTSLPFTRFIVGHADYTPTDLRADKLKGSTWSHELAMSVVFTSPLMVFSGDPVTYLDSEARNFMKLLPSVWDETKVLPGSEIGELAAFARRNASEWYIGIINGTARKIEVNTDFLGEGNYVIEEFCDEPDRTDAWKHKRYRVDNKSKITISLNNDGGYVARITKD